MRSRAAAVVALLAVVLGVVILGRGGMTQDGPVVSNELAWWQPWAPAGIDAVVGGVLTQQGGCLLLSGDAVVWPSGTDWDQGRDELHLRGGATARLGDTISGGGGFSVGAGGDRLSSCTAVAGEDEVIVFNQDDEPRVANGS